jgi:glycerol-3-phosphate dehydrogenase
VKYTTAPHLAKQVMKKIGAPGGKRDRQPVDPEPLGGDAGGGAQAAVDGDKQRDPKDPDLDTYLASKYGRYGDRIRRLIAEDGDLASWISREPALLAGEVRYAVQEEMAVRLSDVVFRRTGFGNAGCPPLSKLEAVADRMAEELDWNDERKERELADVLRGSHPLIVGQD